MSSSAVRDVNNAASIVEELGIADRVEGFSQAQAVIIYKDHKKDPGVKCRLLNGAKSQVGKIAQKILQDFNATIRNKTGLQQWRKTADVINWFINIEDKRSYRFIKFDICEFYVSISEEALKKALSWARGFTTISEQDERIVLHARQSFLFHKGTPWVKKNNSSFDITMGSFDGAECWETLGLYILHHLTTVYNLSAHHLLDFIEMMGSPS